MVVLQEGLFAHISCGGRMGVVFLCAFIAQVFFIVSTATKANGNDRYQTEMLDDRPFFTRRRFIVLSIWTLIVALVSIVVMFSRTETLIWMDGAFVTETSCVGPFTGEYKLDRSQIVVEHRIESGRHSENNYLAISQPGKPRSLFVEINGGWERPELVALSPQAMQHYYDHMQAVGMARSTPQ